MSRARRTSYPVLALGLAATALASYRLDRAAAQRDEIRFQTSVASVRDRIRDRIDESVALLLAGRGLFAAHEAVDVAAFRRFADKLDIRERHPGTQGVGFARRVGPDERAPLEAEMRRQGQQGFHVWPEYPRPEYFPIVLLEPLDRRNRAAVGFDMYSEPARREAMARARDGGLPAATERVTLVQEIDAVKQPGFLMYVPVYRGGGTPPTLAERREALVGLIYSPFRVGDFLQRIGEGGPSPMVSFDLADEDAAPGNTFLHRSGGPAPGARYRPRFMARLLLPVAGRMWQLAVHSTPAFDAFSDRPHVFALGALGAALSVVLSVIMAVQVRGRARAEQHERQMQAERNNLRALFMQAPAAIAIVRGPELRYELSNPLNDELVQGRALIGKTVAEALPESADDLLPVLQGVYRTGEPFVATETPVMVPAPGEGERQIYLSGTYQPLRAPDGSTLGVMSFAYEVTDLVLARNRMEELAADLRNAVRTRDDFLSVAGHELRTPLAALQLQLEGLDRQIGKGALGAVPPLVSERLRRAVGQVGRLERLITELLDVARVTSGRLVLQPEELDLGALLREVSERVTEQASRAGCALSVDVASGVTGRWDRMRLDQVLTNVLGNAIKYGAGKPIAARVDRPDSGWARVVVVDHGIGIPREDQDRVFGRFERAVSVRNYGGLGLGLWISRQIVEAHGGRISVESAPAAGSTFIVELPTAPPSVAA